MPLSSGARSLCSVVAPGHAQRRRSIVARAAPVEKAAATSEATSRAVEILGSREVCFINDRGEIEQIDVNVEDHTNRTISQRVKGFASGSYLQTRANK